MSLAKALAEWRERALRNARAMAAIMRPCPQRPTPPTTYDEEETNVSTFKYDHMTKPLKKYLAHLEKRPPYLYDKKGPNPHTPTEKSQAAVDKWKAKAKELDKALPEGEPKGYYYAKKVWLCRDETIDGEPDEHLSPSGQYKLVVTHHRTGKGTWHYTKGRVYSLDGDEPIATVYRNYSQFPFSWVEGHPDGHAYLVCGEDYQGQTVVQLDTGEMANDLSVGTEKGWGFCWVRHYPSPDGTKLAVEGCHWACPYEVRVYDFSDPMNQGWPELFTDSRSEDFLGWNDDGSCSIGRRFERINLPDYPQWHGREYDRLTIEEDDELEALAEKLGVDVDAWLEEAEETVTVLDQQGVGSCTS